MTPTVPIVVKPGRYANNCVKNVCYPIIKIFSEGLKEVQITKPILHYSDFFLIYTDNGTSISEITQGA